MSGPFTEDFRTTPYWWDRTPRPDLEQPALPSSVDVAIVGSGYTGLSAALQTVRGGRSTAVFDAEDAGWGCSTRNGGQISSSIKPDHATLARTHGPERARAILKEGENALAWIGAFIEAEGIDCDFAVVGKFHAAHSPARYRALARSLESRASGIEDDAYLVPRSEQEGELGSEAYFGGVVYPRHASLDPARFHQGLLDRARAAGAEVLPNTPVTGMSRDGDRFHLETPHGTVSARDVVIGTNGYTQGVTPWLRRRVIPIGSYIIATEPLAADLMDELMPRNRIVTDTRKVVYYYRASPDRTRILFGGRVSYAETDPRKSGPRLRAELVRLFPQLADVRISHSWLGFIAYTFDTLAHVGRHDGVYYAMGYCGSGVSMASYLGMRLGEQILGRAKGWTAFDGLTFPTRPLYTGRPWFLAPSVMLYRLRDRIDV